MFNTKTKKGFTIVELLIVVVVIAILAAIVIVSYNGIQSQAIDSSIQSSLSSASKKLEAYKIKNNSYPSSLLDVGITDTELIRFEYSTENSDAAFCLSGTSPRSKTIAYHVSSSNLSPASGVCDGHNPPDFEPEAPFVLQPKERTFGGDGSIGLTIDVPEAWTSLSLSWNAQPGAQRYELQSRTSPTADWRYHRINNGNIYIAYSDPCPENSTSCTGRIPGSTTTMNWAVYTSTLPLSVGQNFEYRIRYLDNNSQYSDWDTVVVSNPVQSTSDFPRRVSDFNVSFNEDLSRVNLTWSQIPEVATNMNEAKYELQSRTSPSADWRYHRYDTGSIYTAYTNLCNEGSSSCTSNTPYNNTSLSWSYAGAKPQSAGSVYDYRIRFKLQGTKTLYSDWVTLSLANPVQSNSDLPQPSGFKVEAGPNLSNVTLSWDQVPNFAATMNEVKYDIQTRLAPSGEWRYHKRDYGSLNTNSYGDKCTASSGVCSGQTPYNTTSMTWTLQDGRPHSVGTTFDYRMRIKVEGKETYYSDWVTRTISNPVQSDSDVPSVTGFNVTNAADWSSITLSWNQVPDFAPTMISEVKYEVQTRTSPSGSWRYHRTQNGIVNVNSYGDPCTVTHSSCSGLISYNTTSMNWTSGDARPPVSGGTYEYRIRVKAMGSGGTFYSNWVTRSLTR